MKGRIYTADHKIYELPPLLSWRITHTGTVPCDSFSVTFVYGPGGSAVYLRQDGGVEIQGRYVNIKGGEVAVSGSLTVNGVPYKPCNC